MRITSILALTLAAVGLGGMVVATSIRAQASPTRTGMGAPSESTGWVQVGTNGAAVGSDDGNVYVYQASTNRLCIVSKSTVVNGRPEAHSVDLNRVR